MIEHADERRTSDEWKIKQEEMQRVEEREEKLIERANKVQEFID